MTVLINTQQNISPLIPPSGDVPEIPPALKSEDFISKAIDIVRASAQEKDFNQIDMPLHALITKWCPTGVVSSTTYHALIQQIKDSRLFIADLPTIYRHLILDLQFDKNPDFGLPDFSTYNEEFRIAYVKIAAQRDGKRVSIYIQKYGITSQEALVEIAKLAAQQNGYGVSIYIQKYGITSQEALVEIAKLAAQQDGSGVSEYIQKYGITSQEALVEIAKLAAKQDGYGVSIYIQKYGITSQEALVEIAKLAAKQDGSGVSEYIQNYGITSQEALVEIAKLVAQQNGTGVSKYIQKYGITSQEALVEIAKLAAQQNGSGVSIYIQDYGITSQETLVEIAKLAAKQNGSGVSKYIQNYGITSQEALVEIAKLAAQQNGSGVSEYIQNYGITSQDALLKIATLAIRKSGFPVFSFLINYNLNQINRAILIARFIGTIPEIMQNITTYFPEKDHSAVLEQYPELRVLGINDNFVSEYLYFFKNDKIPDSSRDKRTALYLEIIRETDPRIKTIKTNMLRTFCSILDFSDDSPSLLEKLSSLFSSIEKEKDQRIQEQKLHLIAGLLMHCRVNNMDKKALVEQFSLLNAVFDLQDPALRSHLSYLYVDNLTNPVLRVFIKKNLIGIAQKKNQCAAADLALLLLAPLITNVAPPYVELHFAASKTHVLDKNPEIHEVSFIERMKELLNHSYFQRDRLKTKSLLRSLRTLVDAPQLSNTQKTAILRDLIFSHDFILIKDKHFSQNQYCEQLLRSAEIVALLVECNQLDRLTTITHEQLQDQIPEVFASALKIDIPDCNNRVLNTFATWRKPSALLTYAGKLQSLPEKEKEKVLPFLKKYAESVLSGTFVSSRYDTSTINASEHWLKIHEKAPALIEEWKKGSRDSEGVFEVMDTDEPCDLLLSGTEVGSCQSVDGAPSYSKCLAAYLMDPKIRMMAVKNKNGVTVARCMMRLLWDKKAKKFVLFQEKKYPLGCNSSYEIMLDKACKRRAEKLGIALLVKDKDAQEGDVTSLQAFKGKAPFEYVDASDEEAIQTDAGYEISQCKYIYRPENF